MRRRSLALDSPTHLVSIAAHHVERGERCLWWIGRQL